MTGRLFTPDGPAVTPTKRASRAAAHRRAQLALALEFPRTATPAAEALAFIDAADALADGWLATTANVYGLSEAETVAMAALVVKEAHR